LRASEATQPISKRGSRLVPPFDFPPSAGPNSGDDGGVSGAYGGAGDAKKPSPKIARGLRWRLIEEPVALARYLVWRKPEAPVQLRGR